MDFKYNIISQKGQDLWVIRDVFNYKRNGFFVDLAATDGIDMNNTILLEKELGWSGICIEPNPKYYQELIKNRNCMTLELVIDQDNDTEIMFRHDNNELGGIVSEDTDNSYRIRGGEIDETKLLKLKTKTLESVLDKLKAPKVIDYLSLDVEGAEERVLKNFPFDRYTILALTIERPTPELERNLFDNGYVFAMKSKLSPFDSFYIHKSIPNFDNIYKESYSPTPKKDW